MSSESFWKNGRFDAKGYRAHCERERKALEARRAAACAKTLECGGWCRLAPNHEDECLCDGDTDGPGTCPA
jgi:hypothetical protein